ncbi:ATP-dependent helicase [Lapillicoccus jejuensis]|uniref:DNA 3'-5' helicase n=1 Tax=Lapillicoccus jejuensis TaxID=402171 RepID=A0A542DW53_9MICO|nr:ATP-dependent DNA helicase [Lapillicoccus jejuensis]TQJ07329.1 superfamily I DNA/RNA helicase [Lapillicoccus jejuensis]
MVDLRRAPAPAVGAPVLDGDQRRAVEHRGALLRVLGAPGTGKTTTAVEVVVDRVARDGLSPDACLLLTASRTAAARLRDRVTARVGGTTTEPLARTHQAFGFGVLRREAALRGEPAPRLLSGPEQDVVLRDLLAGHASGDVTGPVWPPHVQAAVNRRGFRAELRDLLMRAVELGLEPPDLARLGREHARPEWVAAADVLREYDEVTALSRPGGYDPAWILTAAADRLEDDPQALARTVEQVRLVVVDDAQELTPAAARVLRVLARAGVSLVLLGDPDSAVQTFRGADPRLVATGWAALAPAGDPAPTVVLGTVHRQGPALRTATAAVARRIGALGGGAQRSALAAGPADGRLDVALLRAGTQEAAHVAAELRAAHLLEGVPWDRMAVIVRGRSRDAALRRALTAQGVPVASGAAEIPVRDEVAVRPLLELLDLVLRVARDPGARPTPEQAVDLLLSPLGECDAVRLRRLRRLLRRAELDEGGTRTSDELLADGVLDLGGAVALGLDGAPLRRLAAGVAAGVDAARTAVDPVTGRPGWAPGVTAETILWAVWQGLDVADPWRRRALRGGPRGQRADRDLDAVVALFGAVGAFVDRLPAAGPDAFLEHVRGQDVPGDTLVPRAPQGQAVSVLTPASAAGLEWDLVVVAGVQEGVWPDLRLRGSLLGSEDLVAVVTGRGASTRAAQAAVRYDETRLLHVAVSRARRRVLVTAVRSEDEQPSPYLDVVDPPPEAPDGDVGGAVEREVRRISDVRAPLTLPALVARLRRELLVGTVAQARSARAGLERLVEAGVPGADPRDWWALRGLSDDRPLRAPEQPVRVSPSKVESFETCALRWLLTTAGGDSPSQGRANLGTLVHDIAAELGDEVDVTTLVAEVDRRWGRLGLPSGWATERLREEAHGMVTRLVDYYDRADREGWTLAGAEVGMRAEVGRAVVAGRVDRLERDGEGRLRVLDYKTGSTTPSQRTIDDHLQLAVYQLAVEQGGFEEHGTESAGAAILRLGRNAPADNPPIVQRPLAEHDDPGWAEEVVHRVADGMAGASVLATAGQHCQFCPVRTSCPLQPEGRVLS